MHTIARAPQLHKAEHRKLLQERREAAERDAIAAGKLVR